MPDLNPKIDNFTNGVNKTIPSVTENLSPKIRKFNTESAIGSVKGDICNKIDGAVNLITSIKTGAFSLFDKVTNFDLDGFFEGPLNDLTGKINDITKNFNNALDNFKNQEFNLQSSIDNQIKKINNQLTERFESARIAVNGFDNSLNDIKNFSNKTIRDINVNPLEKSNLQGLLCDNAKQDLIDNALTQKSISSLAQQQEDLINKSNTLINNDKLLEETVTNTNSNETLNREIQTNQVEKNASDELRRERLKLRASLEIELLINLKNLKRSGIEQEQINELYKEGIELIDKTVDERLPLT